MSVRYRTVLLFFVAVALALWACADLTVANLNEPDRERVLTSFHDAEALVSGSYNTWFKEVFNYGGPSLFLSQQPFQHSAPWNCSGSAYSRIPRISIQNYVAWNYFGNTARNWFGAYRSITGAREGLTVLDYPDVAGQADARTLARLEAFGKFTLGIAHGTVALFYDQGFVGGPTEYKEPKPYHLLMDAALGYLDEAIAIASNTEFTIPHDWMQADVDSDQFVRIAHSHKARLRAQVARTPEERAAVDWTAVIADVDAGIQDDHLMEMDWNNGWYNAALDYSTWSSRNQLPYFVYGMADQAGNYQEWVNLPLGEMRHILPDGRPVLIITPDLRFPQGATIEEQRAQGGLYFRMTPPREEGNTWKKPENGTWRWSWYKTGPKGQDYGLDGQFFQPLITHEEMRLLKAEGLYRMGDRAGAAGIVNETRTRAGLSPTDGSGSNASCVPRLHDRSCGDLWEMFKWEKRMEVVYTGVSIANWFLDSRGWGDLWVDTPLQFPVPCNDLEVLGMTPCYTFGGPRGEMSAQGSSYRFPGETALMGSATPGRMGVEAPSTGTGCDAPPMPRGVP